MKKRIKKENTQEIESRKHEKYMSREYREFKQNLSEYGKIYRNV